MGHGSHQNIASQSGWVWYAGEPIRGLPFLRFVGWRGPGVMPSAGEISRYGSWCSAICFVHAALDTAVGDCCRLIRQASRPLAVGA